ncbi:hypothetical protein D3C77_766290 [compost metagenome]
MNCPTFFFADVAFHVDWFTQYVHDAAQGSFTYRYFNWVLQVGYGQTTTQTV